MRMKFAAATCILLVAPCICFAQSQQTQAQQQSQSSAQSQSPPPAQASQQNPPGQSSQTPLRVGGNVMQKKVVHMVFPVYPPIAKVAHVSGTVVLHAIIAKDGTVQDLKVISGPELLVGSALEAVKQWTYQPTLLNGEPVEVDTTITVIFSFSDGSASSSPAAPDSAAPEGGIAVVVPKQAPAPPIDPQLKAGILKLLDLSHAVALGQQAVNAMSQQLRPTLLASLPPTEHRDQIVDAYIAKLAALMARQEFVDRISAIYAKYFSLDDVNAMIQFYQTSAGQRMLTAMPKVMAESQQAGADMAQENLPRILNELCKEYPELQGKVKFCPAGTQNESSSLLNRPSAPGVPPFAAPGAAQ